MTHYFSMDEIRCPCGCEGLVVDAAFLEIMNAIRAEFGKPMIVNSWYRCEKHDEEIGGKGRHVTGKAGDFRCHHSLTRWQLITLALAHGINRIGIGATFLHFDVDEDAPTPRIWVYN